MRITSQTELNEFLQQVTAEVEQDIFNLIKSTKPLGERCNLLAQVDALTKVRDTIYARLQRNNPFNG